MASSRVESTVSFVRGHNDRCMFNIRFENGKVPADEVVRLNREVSQWMGQEFIISIAGKVIGIADLGECSPEQMSTLRLQPKVAVATPNSPSIPVPLLTPSPAANYVTHAGLAIHPLAPASAAPAKMSASAVPVSSPAVAPSVASAAVSYSSPANLGLFHSASPASSPSTALNGLIPLSKLGSEIKGGGVLEQHSLQLRWVVLERPYNSSLVTYGLDQSTALALIDSREVAFKKLIDDVTEQRKVKLWNKDSKGVNQDRGDPISLSLILVPSRPVPTFSDEFEDIPAGPNTTYRMSSRFLRCYQVCSVSANSGVVELDKGNMATLQEYYPALYATASENHTALKEFAARDAKISVPRQRLNPNSPGEQKVPYQDYCLFSHAAIRAKTEELGIIKGLIDGTIQDLLDVSAPARMPAIFDALAQVGECIVADKPLPPFLHAEQTMQNLFNYGRLHATGGLDPRSAYQIPASMTLERARVELRQIFKNIVDSKRIEFGFIMPLGGPANR